MKQLLAISIVLGICTAIPIMAQAPADSAKAHSGRRGLNGRG